MVQCVRHFVLPRLKKDAGFPQDHFISYLQSLAPFLSAKKALVIGPSKPTIQFP